jgi:hypothetical protein
MAAAIGAPHSFIFNDSSLPLRPQLAWMPFVVDFDLTGTIASTDPSDKVRFLQNQMNTLYMRRYGWKSSIPLRFEDALLDGIHIWSFSW